MLAATNRPDAIDPALRRPGRFDREIIFPIPDRQGRREILAIHTRAMPLAADVNLDEIADLAYGYVGADLKGLCQVAATKALRRQVANVSDVPENLDVNGEDFDFALKQVQPAVLRSLQIQAPKVQWSEIGGLTKVKQTLQEAVGGALIDPALYAYTRAKAARGVLLYGPPGTGKTLLAKAIAGEAGVPFFSISGSEFVEMFVGVGASRVRDLFRKAKESAPCIVFIDEIDAVGRQRGAGIGGGNDEREQTLNQLLTEMDGFEGNSGVIVIAATNRVDVLDSALLRPGRFDRQVVVDLPTYNGRLSILEVHARNKKIAPEVSLPVIARRTPGFSGASLANLLNEAAILTARRRKEAMTMQEVEDAMDRVTIGLSLTPLLDSRRKRMTAYHEVGHALLTTLLQHADELNKVTIIPRSGGIEGFTQFLPNEDTIDSGLYSRNWLLDRITVSLGGLAAEAEVFGDDETSTGASNDIQQVTNLARQMVTLYGMSELGPLALESMDNQVFLGRNLMPRSEVSEEMASKIDAKVREIALGCLAQARQTLRQHRSLMDQLVDLLMERETIDGEEFRQIVRRSTEIPAKAMVKSV